MARTRPGAAMHDATDAPPNPLAVVYDDSPLTPAVLVEYEAALPGTADRLLALAEEHARHETDRRARSYAEQADERVSVALAGFLFTAMLAGAAAVLFRLGDHFPLAGTVVAAAAAMTSACSVVVAWRASRGAAGALAVLNVRLDARK